jgi:hypothetical protein
MDTYAGASAGGQDLLVPVLSTEDGAPDGVAIAAWHLALSNFVGVQVPHDLLALWLFPARGGLVLLAPAELARDRVELKAPEVRLSQHELFLLEERVRRAGYRSVLAIPVRTPARDLGLALFARLDAGHFGPVEAVRLHEVVHHLVPTFLALVEAPPFSLTARPPIEVTDQNVVEAVARAAAEARTPAEVLRLVSGELCALVPHEVLDVAVGGQREGTWALLSGPHEGRRWGESTALVSQAVEALIARAGPDETLAVPDLRSAGLMWPTYRESRAIQRVRAAVGVRLAAAGATDAWLLLGGGAPGIFRDADLEVVRHIGPVVALRVHGLRAALDLEVARADARSLSGAHGRAGRIAATLAETAHWGDAMADFVADVRGSLGFERARFVLRLGDDQVVEHDAGDSRPLQLMGRVPLSTHRLAAVLAGTEPFAVSPRGDLAIPLRVAGRVTGLLELLDRRPDATGDPVAGARLLADLVAPHVELVRRSALPARADHPARA